MKTYNPQSDFELCYKISCGNEQEKQKAEKELTKRIIKRGEGQKNEK